MAAALVTATSMINLSDVSANHPVLLEGNCLVPPAGTSPIITAGTCGDYDGDGLIGTAEDMDGDRVFGTVAAALGAGTGANQNGRVVIVTSGVFAEVVTITAANGNVTFEAAPGVDADIDAILQGDPGSAGRQNAPGIVVNSPSNRIVTIRNITSRNWTDGIRVQGSSRVFIDNCRIEQNVNHGIRVLDNARVTISNTQVSGTGFRVGGGTDFPGTSTPAPGVGILYAGNTAGVISNTTVTRSFGAGIMNAAANSALVELFHVVSADSNPSFVGFKNIPIKGSIAP
jgi:parallel beta-helix repeat protein